jgi:hypothetical protein
VNGIRSFLVWHSERFAFGHRFTWKYITAPWVGAALALFTYALIQSGVAIFGGDFSSSADGAATASYSQVLANFGVGVLAGYGAQNVFVWLDAQVERIFQVQPANVKVPDLTGKEQKDVEDILKEARLTLGDVQEEDLEDASQAGKVLRQTPSPGFNVAVGASVNIIVGRLKA